jgi:hypothetical protein
MKPEGSADLIKRKTSATGSMTSNISISSQKSSGALGGVGIQVVDHFMQELVDLLV